MPSWLRVAEGEVPTRSIVLQCVVALAIPYTHTLQQALANVGAILTFFAALVAVSVIRRAFSRVPMVRRPGIVMLIAARDPRGRV